MIMSMSITAENIIGLNAWLQSEKIAFFENTLLATKRAGIEKIIEFTRTTDFYYAPSSTRFHSNYKGGLLDHSLLVYATAIQLRDSMVALKPELATSMDDDSIAISALLHDLCKTAYYVETQKWRKNESNTWESYIGYEINDTFPIGHGEKSVIMLQKFGLDLTLCEMLAIRYHMGMWSHVVDTGEDSRHYFRALEMCPLVAILQNADFMSSFLLETKINN